MTKLPPSCSLDGAGLAAQGERYRRVSRSVAVVERGVGVLLVRFADDVDVGVIEELIAVERGCCPFLSIAWDAPSRGLSICVDRVEDEPALEAIADALGAGPPRSGERTTGLEPATSSLGSSRSTS